MCRILRSWKSEYQYLFNRVREAATDGTGGGIDNAYPLPNIARRVLEMFIAFRRPDRSGDFTGGLRGLGCDDVRTARVLRFVHTFSHSDVVDEGATDATCVLEAAAVLKDVLSLIEEADERHYKAMIKLCEDYAGLP